MPFHIKWEDNVYEIILHYLKFYIVRLQVPQALYKVAKGASVASLSQSDQSCPQSWVKPCYKFSSYLSA